LGSCYNHYAGGQELDIGELFSLNAKRLKDKPAIYFQDQMLTYQQFDERTNKLSHALYSLGHKKGTRIAILSKNHLEYPVIIFTAVKSDFPFTPLNYRMTGDEMVSILNHCEASILFLTEEFIDRIEEIRNRIPVKHFILLAGDNYEGYTQLEALLIDQPSHKPEVLIEEEDIYYIGYTSGTTSIPKGVIHTQSSRKFAAMMYAIEFGINSNDIQLVPGPIYHSAPHQFSFVQLFLGGTVVIMKEFDAEEVLKNIEKYRITNVFMAPTMYNFILQLEEKVKKLFDLSSMKTLICAGSPQPTRVKEGIIALFQEAGLYEFYGSTETGMNTILRPSDQMKTVRSVGKPSLYNDIKILNEGGKPVSRGEIGEIYIKTPTLLKGYLNDQERFEKTNRNGYFTAGDLGRIDEEGYVYLVDRKRDMIVRRSKYISG
jgi:long-chain acyl-CoA synthetase